MVYRGRVQCRAAAESWSGSEGAAGASERLNYDGTPPSSHVVERLEATALSLISKEGRGNGTGGQREAAPPPLRKMVEKKIQYS